MDLKYLTNFSTISSSIVPSWSYPFLLRSKIWEHSEDNSLICGEPSVLLPFQTIPEALLRQATRSGRDKFEANKVIGSIYLVGKVEDGRLDGHHKCDPLIVASHRSIVPILLVDLVYLLRCHRVAVNVFEWWIPFFKVHNASHVLLEWLMHMEAVGLVTWYCVGM